MRDAGSINKAAKVLGLARSTVQDTVKGAHKPRIVIPVFHLTKTEKVLVIGDAHDSPAISKDRFEWIGRHANEMGCDHVLSIGDFLTMDSLCRYTPNDSYSGRFKGTVEDDFKSGEESLERLKRGLAGHEPEQHVTFGNHEDRVFSFSERTPEIFGILQNRLHAVFRDAGFTWSEFGAWHFIDGVGFTHIPLNRLGKPYGGKNCEITVANEATHDVVFGHSHQFRNHTAAKLGSKPRITVLNVACALPQGHIEHYARHSNTGWSWGVTEILIANGSILDHSFVSMASLERRYGS